MAKTCDRDGLESQESALEHREAQKRVSSLIPLSSSSLTKTDVGKSPTRELLGKRGAAAITSTAYNKKPRGGAWSDRSCPKVTVGEGKVANAFVLKYLKQQRHNAPYVRLTCLAGGLPDETVCCVAGGDGERVKTQVCVPARILVDLMHVLLTGNKDFADYADDCIYTAEEECTELCIITTKEADKVPFAKRPVEIDPPNQKHEPFPNIHGAWHFTMYRRGGLFLVCEESKRGRVFPLCHEKQVPVVFAAVDGWLGGDFETADLIVECRVPERVDLFPMPREDDDFCYDENQWPELSASETESLVAVTSTKERIVPDPNEDPYADFSDCDNVQDDDDE